MPNIHIMLHPLSSTEIYGCIILSMHCIYYLQGFRQDFVRGYAREVKLPGGLGGVPPRPEKKLNSKVSETNFRDSRVPVC